MAEVLDDFRTLQYYISAIPTEPEHQDDYYTEGWAALRQCALDGQYVLDFAADTSVPEAQGGEDEQEKAELKQWVNMLRCARMGLTMPPSESCSTVMPEDMRLRRSSCDRERPSDGSSSETRSSKATGPARSTATSFGLATINCAR